MDTNETATISDPIGSILKEARTAQGLTIEAIAQKLRIGKRKLIALEEEDEVLNYDVYNIGFLRLYARYLGLDEEDLCEKFKQTHKPFELSSLSLPAPTAGKGKPSLPILGFSLISFIAILVGWKWVEHQRSSEVISPLEDIEPAPQPLEQAAIPNETAAPSLENNPNYLSPAPSLPETSFNIPLSPVVEESPSAAPPQPVSVSEKVMQPTTASFPAIEESPSAVPAQPVAVSEQIVQPADASAPLDPSAIKINAIEDAWVEVKDYEGNILVSRTLKPGESLEFKNPSTLYLKTGNARGVQLISTHKTINSLGNAGEVRSGISLDPKNWVEELPQTDYQE